MGQQEWSQDSLSLRAVFWLSHEQLVPWDLDVVAALVAVEAIAVPVGVAASADDTAFLPYPQQVFQRRGMRSYIAVEEVKYSEEVVEVGKVLESKMLAEKTTVDRTAIEAEADHKSGQKFARKTVMDSSDFESMMRHKRHTVVVEGGAGAALALPWLAMVQEVAGFHAFVCHPLGQQIKALCGSSRLMNLL